MRRRDFLKSTVYSCRNADVAPDLLAGAAALPVEKSQAFDFAWLKGHARALAGAGYQPPEHTLPKSLANLDYDQYQAIRFRAERSQWAGEAVPFRVQFFHRGPMFKEPVRMYEVVNGQAQEIIYDPAMFDFRKSGINIAGAAERRRLRRLSRSFPHRLERRYRRLSRCQLLPRRRRGLQAIWHIGARAGHRHGPGPRRRVPALHRVLAGASGEGVQPFDRLRSAEFAEHRRCLSL